MLARGELRFPDSDEASPEDAIADALAAIGLRAESGMAAEEEFYLWPDNVAAFNLWLSIQTQWVIGMNGRTGLDYPGVEVCMRLHQVHKKEQREMFVGLQAMEHAALDEWSKK